MFFNTENTSLTLRAQDFENNTKTYLHLVFSLLNVRQKFRDLLVF